MAFGATVLVPTVFAFIAASYAISTLTTKPLVIFGVGLVWAFIILTIDRALLASYRAHVSIFRKAGQFCLRLVVALLMGVTIAHPLVLLLFRDTITNAIEEERQREVANLRAGYSSRKERVDDAVRNVQGEIAALRAEWERTFQAEFLVAREVLDDGLPAGLTEEEQTALRASIAEATADIAARIIALETQIAELTPGYATLQEELAHWQSEFEREVNGQRSGIVGLGPRARSIQDDHLAWRRDEARRLGGLLEHLTQEKSGMSSRLREAEVAVIESFERQRGETAELQRQENERVAGLRRQVEADQAAAFVTQQNSLRETIRVEIDTRLSEVSRLQEEIATLGAEESGQVAAVLAQPRRDILTQTLALHALFDKGAGAGRFALYTYGILTLLFMLVDTIPILVKFLTRAGPYDAMLSRDEIRADAEHAAFRKSHRRYMKSLSEGNLITVTRNKALEDAMIDGVEHSRAAREFLLSLIEMERAFEVRIEAEKGRDAEIGPEKAAALESMKQHFYQNLHERMKAFFGTPETAIAARQQSA